MVKKISMSSLQAEMDAHTLAEYQSIISDSKRYNAAAKAAKSSAEEYEKKAQAYKRACGGSIKRKK